MRSLWRRPMRVPRNFASNEKVFIRVDNLSCNETRYMCVLFFFSLYRKGDFYWTFLHVGKDERKDWDGMVMV